MRNKALFLFLLAFGIFPALRAQTSWQTKSVPALSRKADIFPGAITKRYAPALISMEMPSPGSASYRGYLMGLKQEIAKNFVADPGAANVRLTGTASPPTLGDNFIGNNYDFSVPNDNDMAISNAGKIVSVINSTVYMMDE